MQRHSVALQLGPLPSSSALPFFLVASQVVTMYISKHMDVYFPVLCTVKEGSLNLPTKFSPGICRAFTLECAVNAF